MEQLSRVRQGFACGLKALALATLIPLATGCAASRIEARQRAIDREFYAGRMPIGQYRFESAQLAAQQRDVKQRREQLNQTLAATFGGGGEYTPAPRYNAVDDYLHAQAAAAANPPAAAPQPRRPSRYLVTPDRAGGTINQGAVMTPLD